MLWLLLRRRRPLPLDGQCASSRADRPAGSAGRLVGQRCRRAQHRHTPCRRAIASGADRRIVVLDLSRANDSSSWSCQDDQWPLIDDERNVFNDNFWVRALIADRSGARTNTHTKCVALVVAEPPENAIHHHHRRFVVVAVVLPSSSPTTTTSTSRARSTVDRTTWSDGLQPAAATTTIVKSIV